MKRNDNVAGRLLSRVTLYSQHRYDFMAEWNMNIASKALHTLLRSSGVGAGAAR